MKEFHSLALSYVKEKLWVLDQTLLPEKEEWITVGHPDDMAKLIKRLSVRGAPLIGVAAAVAIALFAEKGASPDEILSAITTLRQTRPTAVNLMWALDTLKEGPMIAEVLTQKAEAIVEAEMLMSDKMADHGASLISDGENILTHCNSGGLATVGIGTALGVIKKAFLQGKSLHVFVDETRPLLQGGRLTTWELEQEGIPYTLICDNMAASLIAAGKIQRVFVGADRIAINGDFANKVGTLSVSVMAKHYGVPFHPVAPTSTIDFACPSGAEIPIEERDPDEVRGIKGSFGDVIWSPKQANVYNPSFDVTPVEMIESLVLDQGVFTRSQILLEGLQPLRPSRI